MSKLLIAFIILLSILILFVLIVFVARYSFNKKTEKEISELFEDVQYKGESISEKDLKSLPKNVAKWLEYSGVVGHEKIMAVRLKQKAHMRLSKDKPWMPVKAEQYFTTEHPGFIWKANIKMAPLFHISGRDQYKNGKGHTSIKLLSILTVADSSGKEIDQGTLLRYLAEMMWFPTAALNGYIVWEAIDRSNAKATMSYGDITASGVFTFNNKGEVVNFKAERYGDFDKELRLETWTIPVRDYKVFQGIKVPTKGNVTWALDMGDFNWFNFEIIDVEYNTPRSYAK